MNIYHIVAGLSGAGLIKYSIKKNMSEWYGQTIAIPDDFSVGPLCYLNKDGCDKRRMWLSDIIKITGSLVYGEELPELYKDMNDKLDQIKNEDKIVVWYGPSSMDTISLYQICSRFRNNSLFKVSVEDLEDYKDMYIPSVGACNPEQILTLTSKIKPITDKEKTSCVKELERLINENKMVRILKDDKVISKEEDFYDELILSNTTKSFLKVPRVVGATMGKSKYLVGDTFIDYRIRKLIDKGELSLIGNKEAEMRLIEVKLP